ncbi:hypothetical protein DFH06DRAFT_1136160 [Mycena polygramma]|nr:hypothetical protein DFH06DRAFT_1136160 [Mycena polygramma]
MLSILPLAAARLRMYYVVGDLALRRDVSERAVVHVCGAAPGLSELRFGSSTSKPALAHVWLLQNLTKGQRQDHPGSLVGTIAGEITAPAFVLALDLGAAAATVRGSTWAVGGGFEFGVRRWWMVRPHQKKLDVFSQAVDVLTGWEFFESDLPRVSLRFGSARHRAAATPLGYPSLGIIGSRYIHTLHADCNGTRNQPEDFRGVYLADKRKLLNSIFQLLGSMSLNLARLALEILYPISRLFTTPSETDPTSGLENISAGSQPEKFYLRSTIFGSHPDKDTIAPGAGFSPRMG